MLIMTKRVVLVAALLAVAMTGLPAAASAATGRVVVDTLIAEPQFFANPTGCNDIPVGDVTAMVEVGVYNETDAPIEIFESVCPGSGAPLATLNPGQEMIFTASAPGSFEVLGEG